ncbi:hypothetical protein B0H13DRAFT_1885413 [Mycena leptocephala]|nr:hypothetical protein B0H13DRAFT_1885413 [Mycena leptocephala]
MNNELKNSKLVWVLATDLRYTFLDLRAQGEIRFSNVFLRIEANIANFNLPHKLLSQEYFVRFCATSQHPSLLEQFDALAEHCTQKDWTSAYNCKLQQKILFPIEIHLLPAGNPQQAETTSTASLSANFWCQEDDSGGSATHRETDEGYHALFARGKTRTPEDTKVKIKEQFKSACLGVATAVDKLRTESGVKDMIAFHWIELLLEQARKIQEERVYNHETGSTI